MDDIGWMAAGLGALYGAAMLLAGAYFALDRYKGLRLVVQMTLWLPLLVLAAFALILAPLTVKKALIWTTGPLKAKFWLGPTIKRWGFGIIRLEKAEKD